MKKIAAFLTDDLNKLKYKSDSSILLMQEMQRRDFAIFQFTPDNIYLEDGELYADGIFLELSVNADKFYAIKSAQKLLLKTTDIIFIRHDPPYDLNYLSPVYLLRLIEDEVKILNQPSSILANPEKISVGKFSHLTPKTITCPNETSLQEFLKTQKTIVLKPLYGHGGDDVIKVDASQSSEALAFLKKHQQIVAQEFLPSVVKGDKRLIIIAGKLLGAIQRVPQSGSFVANLAAGGSAIKTELTSRELLIAKEVGGFLVSENIFFAGIDLIDEHLIEINITSPTGLKSINNLYQIDCEKELIDLALKH